MQPWGRRVTQAKEQIRTAVVGAGIIGTSIAHALQQRGHAVALIVPSVCFETFGIILIESFRQGTPVLARRIGPFPEILEKAGAGELFDGPEQLITAMRRMQADETYRRELGRRAVEAFEQHWSERAVIPQYLDVVRRAAERAGKQRIVERLGQEAPA